MKKLTNSMGYISPETCSIDIMPMSILCQSGEGGSDATLEDMTENDYTFTF